MNPAVVRRVILPVWQWVRRQHGLEVLAELEKTQWLSAGELDDWRWQRIGRLLEHAYANVPYYREIMREVGVDPAAVSRARSLACLPLLDRSTINENKERLRSVNLSGDRFMSNGTGGSTGEPLHFYDDRDGIAWCDAAAWRSYRWANGDVGDRCAWLWGSNFDLSSYQGVRGWLKSRAFNVRMLSAWDLGEGTAELFWNELTVFRPRLVVAYAGALYQWARLLGDHRKPLPGLAAIIVSAETLHDGWRKVIEACFKVPVYNRYGGRDIKFVAQECPARKGLHINAENAVVEIVRDGRVVPSGELGEIVVTRLDNFAMPFIRYRSGDLGVMGDRACDCGRTLPLLERVEGRIQDAIVTAHGKVIAGPFFAHLMKDCPDVKEFQIHQWTLRQLSILIAPAHDEPFTSGDRIERIVRHHLGPDMQIRFEVRDAIPRAPNGKRRVAVSHLHDGDHG